MKEYVCSVCGYVHKTDGELPEDFKCPPLRCLCRCLTVGCNLYDAERASPSAAKRGQGG